MGLKGGSLLIRKFPAYTHNVKFETNFFSYNGTSPPKMLNECNLQEHINFLPSNNIGVRQMLMEITWTSLDKIWNLFVNN
jgi:hypothetical protein